MKTFLAPLASRALAMIKPIPVPPAGCISSPLSYTVPTLLIEEDVYTSSDDSDKARNIAKVLRIRW